MLLAADILLLMLFLAAIVGTGGGGSIMDGGGRFLALGLGSALSRGGGGMKSGSISFKIVRIVPYNISQNCNPPSISVLNFLAVRAFITSFFKTSSASCSDKLLLSVVLAPVVVAAAFFELGTLTLGL